MLTFYRVGSIGKGALSRKLEAALTADDEHRPAQCGRPTWPAHPRLLPVRIDLGRTTDSRTGMQRVADGDGRLACNARRGLAHLARLVGDFPTALVSPARRAVPPEAAMARRRTAHPRPLARPGHRTARIPALKP
ncbi:hypothetical protein ACFU99_37325 [Streptomyces sp. NPDC057654]|uniref:hypothetical protein n=1 Tax=Streptomyces sp. NPDC057654 TaxID=3346196 RepID=UPI0036CD1B68